MDLLISDLHLYEGQKNVPHLFFHFMENIAPESDNLYVLGDLFEYWIGDDFKTELSEQVIACFKQYTAQNKGLFFIHGNRDFLLGDDFLQRCGGVLLPELSIQKIAETPVLLMHGDSLCTLDIDYQNFKKWIRAPQWQAEFLKHTLEQRIAIAQKMREQSQNKQQQSYQQMDNPIMDVNPEEVIAVMESQAVHRLIHGHTHRQKIHSLDLKTGPAQRIVLGDWGKTGSYCRCHEGQFELINFS